MDAFPNEHHLASWAGMSAGNDERAGKKKRMDIKGEQTVEGYPGGSILGSNPNKKHLPASKYDSLVSRKGKNKALIAIGHKLLVAAYLSLEITFLTKHLGTILLQKCQPIR